MTYGAAAASAKLRPIFQDLAEGGSPRVCRDGRVHLRGRGRIPGRRRGEPGVRPPRRARVGAGAASIGQAGRARAAGLADKGRNLRLPDARGGAGRAGAAATPRQRSGARGRLPDRRREHHPFSRWQEQPITSDERYRRLVESYKRLTDEQLVFGFHVHVGLEDREVALGVMNHLRVWLAPLLALSANSPFWLGEDT